MKTIFKRLSVIIVVVLFFSCSSNSNDTACVPIPCLNGGTSRPDCGCNCPSGFTGSNCNTQITPTQVKITNIRVTKFPDTNNGNWWDTLPNSGADIYLTIENSNLTTIWTSPTYFQDATGIGTYYFDFVPTTPIIFTNLTSGYILNIYDQDTVGTDQFISFCAFNPYISSGGFPTTKTFTNSTSTFSFQLTLAYVW